MFDAYLMEEVKKHYPSNEHLEGPGVVPVMGIVVHGLCGRHYLLHE